MAERAVLERNINNAEVDMAAAKASLGIAYAASDARAVKLYLGDMKRAEVVHLGLTRAHQALKDDEALKLVVAAQLQAGRLIRGTMPRKDVAEQLEDADETFFNTAADFNELRTATRTTDGDDMEAARAALGISIAAPVTTNLPALPTHEPTAPRPQHARPIA
jgi:hypothetical protein